jgi:outer membrane protein TolC
MSSSSLNLSLLLCSLILCPHLSEAEELSWKEIAYRVLKNSPDLRIQKIQPELAKLKVDQAKSEFDPTLRSQVQISGTDGNGDLTVATPVPTTTPFENEESDTRIEMAVQQKLKYGTQLEIQGSIKRSENDIISPNVSFNGKDDSNNISLILRQPILEGRGQNIQTTRIRQADLSLAISKHQLAAYAETLIYRTLLRSLDLSLHQERLNVVKNALQIEKKELQEVLLKIEAGALAPTEKIAAEAALATREQHRTQILNAIEQARLDLVHSLSPNPSDLWEYQITFPTFVVPPWAEIHPFDFHLNSAYQNRHDLLQSLQQHKIRKLDITYAKNGLLPRLDFFANLGYSDFDRRDAFNSIDTKGDGAQYSLGLQLEIPLSKRKDRSDLKQARYQVQQAESAIQNLKRILERDLRKVFAEHHTFQTQFKQAKLMRTLRKQSLDTELDKRSQGLSTSLQVERARNEYLDSQFREIEIEVHEFKTRLTLFYKDGTLLNRLDLTL